MDSRFTPDHIAWHESAHPLSYFFFSQGNPTIPLAALYFCPIKETQISVNHSSFPQGLPNWLCHHSPCPNHYPPSLHLLSSPNNQVPFSLSSEELKTNNQNKMTPTFPLTSTHSLFPSALLPKTTNLLSKVSLQLVPCPQLRILL